MGAGLSGLACAKILEDNGINPDIFESRGRVGDRFVNCEILLSVLNRPVKDSLAFFSEEFNIYFQPVANIKKLIIYSKNEQATITGKLGFTNIRGRDEDSFENQLARQVEGDITFNSDYSYEDLLREYTHVILAVGDFAYTTRIQGVKGKLSVIIRGVTAEGQFDRYVTRAWLDNRFAPGGYGYLIPYSEQEANIVIAYPDTPENRKKNDDQLWDDFFSDVCEKLGQELKKTDEFEIEDYILGICDSPRIGNTFFTGNCYGAIMPFLGFGQFSAILTGVYAAYDLCGLGNYEELTGNLRDSFQNSMVLRRGIEKLDNHKLDLLVKSLQGKAGERLFNSERDYLKIASKILQPFL